MDHEDGAAAIALVNVVDSETVDLDPTLLKGPTFEVRPSFSDHLVRRPQTLATSIGLGV